MCPNKTVSIIICDDCINYRKKQTMYMETFYHCVADSEKTVRSCIKKVMRSTPRINEVMLKSNCNNFKKK